MKEIRNLAMYYGASVEIFRRARLLRNNTTEAENVLWERIKNNQIEGFKFRNQHPFNKFIVDFYCHKLRLIIELDGEIHSQQEVEERDRGREFMINNFDVVIIRFKNDEVLYNIENILIRIKQKIQELTVMNGNIAK